MFVHNLEVLGHTHDLNVKLLAPVAEHFERVGRALGYPINQNNEYDVLAVKHQIPGGMVGTLKANLATHKMDFYTGSQGTTFVTSAVLSGANPWYIAGPH